LISEMEGLKEHVEIVSLKGELIFFLVQ
jgi:hypothetical protein